MKLEKPIVQRRKALLKQAALDREKLVQQQLDLLQCPDLKIRSQAAEAFAWLRDIRAIAPLIVLLGSGSEWLRDRSGFALGRMPRMALAPLLATVETAKGPRFDATVKTVVRMKKAALPAMLELLREGSLAEMDFARKALCQIAFDPEILIPNLTTGSVRCTAYTIDILGKSKRMIAFHILLDQSDQLPSGKVKIALGRLARHFPEEVLTCAKPGVLPQRRALILEALGRAGIVEAVPLLRTWYVEAQPGERAIALRYIRKLLPGAAGSQNQT